MKTKNHINLRKVFFTSNYSYHEQIKYIENALKKIHEPTEYSFNFLGNNFKGNKYHNIYVLTETNIESENKLKVLTFSAIEPIIDIYNKLVETPIQRIFKIIFTKKELKIKDTLFQVENTYNNITENTETDDILINFDSRLISLFKLNSKTLTKKSKFIVAEGFYGFVIFRSKKNILLLIER